MSERHASIFRLNPLLSRFVPSAVATMLAPPLEHMLSLRRLARVYEQLADTGDPVDFANSAIDYLKVRFEPHGALDEIPATGPLVMVANHPFGGIEGLYLYSFLATRRSDVRILGNQLLSRVQELRPALFSVDVLGGRAAARANSGALRRALRWVADGGALLVFPSGEVSTFDPATRTVVDSAWSSSVARLVRLTKAEVVPVFIDGNNSPLFHIAGFVHPRLRTALLPRELLNKGYRRIRVQVGRPVTAKQVEGLDGDEALIEHLRLRVYALASDCRQTVDLDRAADGRALEPVARAAPGEWLEREVASLDPAQRLCTGGGLEVWHANGAVVPQLMQEIGRVRELTFRVAGEGSGRSRDVDLFDDYYQQLFVWNPLSREIVGGYRIGHTDRILSRFGIRGLYTSTLFKYHKSLLPSLAPALELGRSFVRPEYQRNFAPLLLLWKGLAAYVIEHPHYRTMFGPVSISNDYTQASRALLTGFLHSRHSDLERRGLARPRHPLPTDGDMRLVRRAAAEVETLEAIESLLNSIERDGKGVPVLLRQYLKLGAKAIGFNVDETFGHSIDVLISVNLDAVDDKVLVKYMGAAGAARFRAARRT